MGRQSTLKANCVVYLETHLCTVALCNYAQSVVGDGGGHNKVKFWSVTFIHSFCKYFPCICSAEIEGEILPLCKSPVDLWCYSKKDFILNWSPNIDNLYFLDTAGQCFVHLLFIDVLFFASVAVLFSIYRHICSNVTLLGKVKS